MDEDNVTALDTSHFQHGVRLMSRLLAAFTEAVPALAPPADERVCGSAFSPAARLRYIRAFGAFDASCFARRGGSTLPPWATVLGGAVEGVLAHEQTEFKAELLSSLRVHLGIPEGKELSAKLPEDPAVHSALQQYTIPFTDPRVALRGQRGVKAQEPVSAWTVLGLLRCLQLTKTEYDDLKLQQQTGVLPAVRELAMDSFAHELVEFNQLEGRSKEPLYASAYGHANLLSLINDGADVQQLLKGSPSNSGPQGRPNNVALVEVKIRGWPYLVIVTTQSVVQGEELLMSYGGVHSWSIFNEGYNRAKAVCHEHGISLDVAGASAAQESSLADGAGRDGAPSLRAAAVGAGSMQRVSAAAPAPGAQARNLSSGSASAAAAGSDESDDQDAPEVPPTLGPRTWMPMGAPVQLLKTTTNHPNAPRCMVVAHVALPVGCAPASLRMTLLTLNMTTLLRRSAPQIWEILQSLLPRAEAVATVLLPAPGVSPLELANYQKQVEELRRHGAAVCRGAEAGGREALLLPSGEAALAGLPLWNPSCGNPAATPAGGHLVCILLQPGVSVPATAQPRAAAAAPPEPASQPQPQPQPGTAPPSRCDLRAGLEAEYIAAVVAHIQLQGRQKFSSVVDTAGQTIRIQLQGRWCLLSEVVAAVPPPPQLAGSLAQLPLLFLEGMAKTHAQLLCIEKPYIATLVDGECLFGKPPAVPRPNPAPALLTGVPPMPPPPPMPPSALAASEEAPTAQRRNTERSRHRSRSVGRSERKEQRKRSRSAEHGKSKKKRRSHSHSRSRSRSRERRAAPPSRLVRGRSRSPVREQVRSRSGEGDDWSSAAIVARLVAYLERRPTRKCGIDSAIIAARPLPPQALGGTRGAGAWEANLPLQRQFLRHLLAQNRSLFRRTSSYDVELISAAVSRPEVSPGAHTLPPPPPPPFPSPPPPPLLPLAVDADALLPRGNGGWSDAQVAGQADWLHRWLSEQKRWVSRWDAAAALPELSLDVTPGSGWVQGFGGTSRARGLLSVVLDRHPARFAFSVRRKYLTAVAADGSIAALEELVGGMSPDRTPTLDFIDRYAQDLHDHLVCRFGCVGFPEIERLFPLPGSGNRGTAFNKFLLWLQRTRPGRFMLSADGLSIGAARVAALDPLADPRIPRLREAAGSAVRAVEPPAPPAASDADAALEQSLVTFLANNASRSCPLRMLQLVFPLPPGCSFPSLEAFLAARTALFRRASGGSDVELVGPTAATAAAVCSPTDQSLDEMESLLYGLDPADAALIRSAGLSFARCVPHMVAAGLAQMVHDARNALSLAPRLVPGQGQADRCIYIRWLPRAVYATPELLQGLLSITGGRVLSSRVQRAVAGSVLVLLDTVAAADFACRLRFTDALGRPVQISRPNDPNVSF